MLRVAQKENLNLRSGRDSDYFQVWTLTVGGRTSFNLGAGDDDLYVRNNQANRVSLNGGRGDDRLFDGGNNPPVIPVGFEEFPVWPWL